MTLNSMKLEVHFQQKQNEDLDDEGFCTLGARWASQRPCRRWSQTDSKEHLRKSLQRDSTMRKFSSQESVLTDLSADLEAISLHSTSSSGGTLAPVAVAPHSSSTQNSPTLTNPTDSLSNHSPAAQSSNENSKEKPKKRQTRSFRKRIESLRRKDKEKLDSAKAPDEDRTRLMSGWKSTKDAKEPVSGTQVVVGNEKPRPFYSTKTLPTGGQSNQALASVKSKLLCESKYGSIYLEDYETSLNKKQDARMWDHQIAFKRDYLFHIPGDYKPGTFPKSLSIESLCPLESGCLADWRSTPKASSPLAGGTGISSGVHAGNSSHALEHRPRRPSSTSTGSRTSLYDNVPDFGSGDDLFDLDQEMIYENLDDILQHVWGLQQKVELWSKAVKLDMEDETVGVEETDSGEEPTNLNLENHSMSDIGISTSDFESTANSLNETEEPEMRERRDSGVGASLTRPCRKLRWHSFQNSHRPSLNSASLEINRQSAAQLSLLQKCSLLRLTAIMEKFSVPHKQSWAWTVPKFMRRSKLPNYRGKMVFGVPLIVSVQRTGQPLPQSIQQAMRYIRSQCLDQVGIFRKSGVKSRIQNLRQMSEASPDYVNYEGQSAYDVADLLKQYFRDLPEPIFTCKLTDTFLQIYQFVPKDQRLQAVQAAIMLMPDENREVLQTLLYFLSDVASSEENQMTVGNLAVCLAPSIFHLNVSKKESTSPRLIHRRGTVGKPDQKDLNENMAATQGLSHMMANCKKLFQIPHDMILQLSSSYLLAEAQPLSLPELMEPNLQGEIQDSHPALEASIQTLLKESSERFKGWIGTLGPKNTELSCKKVEDGHPLRLWKVSTEVAAPPQVVLKRILRERHSWDEDLLQGHVVEALDKNTEVYHYVTDSMAPHPRRDFVVLRSWRTDLPHGSCLLVAFSLEHPKLPLEAGVRATVLTSQYLMEPCGTGHSRVTHICQTDFRGRSPDWYNKVFGHLCAMELVRIRDSFPVFNLCGPETKI
ncbi:stAR-related lipid transfer protein 8 isoform X2 [Notechis scutatus]|uniref:StAR-related lipid transfer protein 8 isoform X2 n=1 Tax=Notechis scutatus TaxID=8663 RepID=A0A6J1V3D4_9SAUR|nr:stAR-related lipid transfer protein 8 isoform X2 [Notechis scutatus]